MSPEVRSELCESTHLSRRKSVESADAIFANDPTGRSSRGISGDLNRGVPPSSFEKGGLLANNFGGPFMLNDVPTLETQTMLTAVGYNSSQRGGSWYEINPVKAGVGMINVAQGTFAIAAGAGIVAAGEGALLTTPVTGPVGVVSGTAATAYGVAKAAGGYARFRRGRQQMWEAADESISDGSAKNLLGWLPSGQKYDDPGEPSFGGYWSGLYDRAREDYWGTAAEALGDFFAFPGDGE